jgi:hypothetical protein
MLFEFIKAMVSYMNHCIIDDKMSNNAFGIYVQN